MKIDITGAMDALQSDPDIRKGFASIRIELTRDDQGNDELGWQLYAGDDKSGEKNWSKPSESFPEALKSLKDEFARARGDQSFVED
jgi:hypothetical protein